jgi:hypothetical protein
VKSLYLILHSGVALWLLLSALFFLATSVTSRAQSPQSSSISLPTELRVRGPGWWPTKGQPSRADYTGPDACAECHELKAETAQSSTMLHAATRPSEAKSLREHDHLRFQTGPYAYQLLTTPEKSTLTVSNASSSLSVDLLWALGKPSSTSKTRRSTKATSAFTRPLNRSTSLPANPARSPQLLNPPLAVPSLQTKLVSASAVTPLPPPQRIFLIQAPPTPASPARPATVPAPNTSPRPEPKPKSAAPV